MNPVSQRLTGFFYCPIDKLAKSLPFEGRIWGFEALSGIKINIVKS